MKLSQNLRHAGWTKDHVSALAEKFDCKPLEARDRAAAALSEVWGDARQEGKRAPIPDDIKDLAVMFSRRSPEGAGDEGNALIGATAVETTS